jgi:ElaB/YqjD/DUF883 family membrane-anchored ribosome-binding protein
MVNRGSFENGPEGPRNAEPRPARADGASERQADAAPVVPRVLAKARRADEKLVTLVQERPIAALCVAALAGYVVGRIVTRAG